MAADPLDSQLLNRPEQLGLGDTREIGDFVEKQRAGVGQLELAAPSAYAGGRPVLDAEQLGLEQCLDQRRAVDRDEGSMAPATQLVNAPRNQFLP